MRILTIDIGTGTQDILLFDSDGPIENSPQLIMPAPTQIIARRIQTASAAQRPIVLTGVTMGGGPCQWAAYDHLRAGLPLYATPDAARTFNDDLAAVQRDGIRIVSEDEAALLHNVERIAMRDLDLDAIHTALTAFGIPPQYDAIAAAVFDHGNAPPDISDRIFRFTYLAERFATGGGLLALGFPRERIPSAMTRLHAVAATAPTHLPLLLMDTAPAAILGALDDPTLAAHDNLIIANIGNFHCLAFHIVAGQIAGCFEHHTGELTQPQLETFLARLGHGTLTNAEIFESKGHGALITRHTSGGQPFLAITGPRRALLHNSSLHPYYAVPHGDMMLAGCFGLLRAYAANYPDQAAAIAQAMDA